MPYKKLEDRKNYNKNYYLKNKEKIDNRSIQYYKDNKQVLRIFQKIYYNKNKEKILKNQKTWYQENKEKINKNARLRYKTDIKFKLNSILHNRINDAIRKNIKSLSTMFLIGCEIDYLMYHLQKQFTKGMKWNNYGSWHIDHIKPCSLFDLSKKSEQLKCFNFKNLQPLWAIDNRRKKDKY